jgi:hypothetical protein
MVNSTCKRNFIYALVIISFISLAAVILVNSFTATYIEPVPVFFGWLLSLANVLLGTRFVLKAMDKGNKRFFAVLFGSMTVRLFVTLIIVVIGLLALKLNELFFIFSLLGFYFAFIAVEVIFINCYSKVNKVLTEKV